MGASIIPDSVSSSPVRSEYIQKLMNFFTYCNMLKIKDAKALLKESNISVTEVAYSVGFNNFSYFITTFKSLTGMTPLVWRKKNQLKS
ncbi:MAG: helix-turn-helix domain-containing protein [Clostridiales bacterium]|nr:helix-turn-helix domain-containing protein [Clostridiales bacterium]